MYFFFLFLFFFPFFFFFLFFFFLFFFFWSIFLFYNNVIVFFVWYLSNYFLLKMGFGVVWGMGGLGWFGGWDGVGDGRWGSLS